MLRHHAARQGLLVDAQALDLERRCAWRRAKCPRGAEELLRTGILAHAVVCVLGEPGATRALSLTVVRAVALLAVSCNDLLALMAFAGAGTRYFNFVSYS